MKTHPAKSSTNSGFAKNLGQLAKRLKTSRQSLDYHSRKPGSPKPRRDGCHDVEAWRRWINARTMLLARHGSSEAPQSDPRTFLGGYDTAVRFMAQLITDGAPFAIPGFCRYAELTLTKSQADRLAHAVGRLAAAAANDMLGAWHLPLLDEDGDE